jgi:glutathione S-transferase
MLKIWGRTNSINVQKVPWCCGELNLKHERADADCSSSLPTTRAWRRTTDASSSAPRSRSIAQRRFPERGEA